MPQDYAEAVLWFRRAAEQNHALAQYRLGRMYYFGKGVSTDHIEAHMWFNIAAAYGRLASGVDRDSAVRLRDWAEIFMTSTQIA